MKARRLLALALLLTACSGHDATGPTAQQVTTPAVAQPGPAAVTQATVTVTLQRIDGSRREYDVPPEWMRNGAPSVVMLVDGVRYEQDGSIWRERTPEELASRATKKMVDNHIPWGPPL